MRRLICRGAIISIDMKPVGVANRVAASVDDVLIMF